MTKALALNKTEWLLIGAFVVLNIVDMVLTVALVKLGYLCLEINLLAPSILTSAGPPHYQFGLLWAFKIGVTLAFIVGLVLVANRLPQMRKWVFVVPVCAMVVVCISNMGSLVWSV